MIAFRVDDMSCEHCVGAITHAVKEADPGARVDIELARHLVRVEPGSAGPSEETIAAAIRDAGYTPVPAPEGR